MIDEEGKNLGEIPSREALNRAKSSGLDLILVNKSTTPPVCRLGNLGKIRYELDKGRKENRKKVQDIKIIRIRPCTQQYDLDREISKANKFLKDGDKVRFECRFRFRELAHPEIGKDKLQYLVKGVQEISKIEKDIEHQGRTMSITIIPK